MTATPKPYAGGRWSRARYWSFIRSALRAASIRWPPKADAMKAARRAYQGTDNARQKWEYWCAACEQWKMGKDVRVDHIEPCGSLKCAEDLPGFVTRMFCEEDGFQVVCKSCHDRKTARERDEKKNAGGRHER